MSLGPDDKTPAVSAASLQLADAAVALSTVASRLANAAELAEVAAGHCLEASRLVNSSDSHGSVDPRALLAQHEELLGHLAEGVHDTRRAVRSARLALEKKGTPP